MGRQSPRNILVTHSRNGQPLSVRRFASIDTAVPRASQLAYLTGEPGDVFEVAHAFTGLQSGTFKVSVGRVAGNFIWGKL